MRSPYINLIRTDMNDEAPHPELVKLTRRRKGWLIAMCVSGFLILIPPILGMGGTVLGMVRAFDKMGKSGGADPDALASDISLALLTTAGGLVVSLLFLVLFFATLIGWLVTCSAVKNFSDSSGSHS